MIAMGIIIVILLLRLEYCTPKQPQYLDRIVTDSIIRKTTVDTVYKYITKKSTVKIDTVPNLVTTYKDTCLDLKVQDYTQHINDSVITGKIIARVTGTLDSLKFNYTYKYPIITKTDSVTIYRTNTVYKQPISLVVGADIGGNQKQFIFEPTVGVTTNKGHMYSLGYDVPQKTLSFGYRKLIKLQK
jgi:hypothetical protein